MTAIESACTSRTGSVESRTLIAVVSGCGADVAITFRSDLVERQPAEASTTRNTKRTALPFRMFSVLTFPRMSKTPGIPYRYADLFHLLPIHPHDRAHHELRNPVPRMQYLNLRR